MEWITAIFSRDTMKGGLVSRQVQTEMSRKKKKVPTSHVPRKDQDRSLGRARRHARGKRRTEPAQLYPQ